MTALVVDRRGRMAVDVGAIALEATSVVGPFDAVNATVFMLDNPIAWAALSG
jgi:hypothetical protein